MAVAQHSAKDEQLYVEVKKLIEGNYDTYENVYELSKKYIYKIINDIVQNHHTTEDMMQETYLQIYNKIGTLQEPRAFYVWAGRIATNLTLRHIQKYRKEIILDSGDDDEEDGFDFNTVANDTEEFIPETVLENTEQQRIIAEILQNLSLEQKLCVQYFYYEEMSVNQIAELMGCSSGTVKSRLNYARKSLKDAISKFEVDNDVKLYSMASLPIFFVVFKAISESVVFSGGAMVAGGLLASDAMVSGGSIGTGSGAAVAEGSAVAAVGATGSATASATGSGFIATAIGKASVTIATMVLAATTTLVSTDAAKEDMIDEYGRMLTAEEVLESSWGAYEEVPLAESSETMNQYSALGEVLADESSADYENIDSGMLESLNYYAEALLALEGALNYSLTDSQKDSMEMVIGTYEEQISMLVMQSETYTYIMETDISGTFESQYYPQIIALYDEMANNLFDFAEIYGKEEVKTAFAYYSAEEMVQAINAGYGAGGLIYLDLSAGTQAEFDAATNAALTCYENWENIIMEMASNPNLSEYF